MRQNRSHSAFLLLVRNDRDVSWNQTHFLSPFPFLRLYRKVKCFRLLFLFASSAHSFPCAKAHSNFPILKRTDVEMDSSVVCITFVLTENIAKEKQKQNQKQELEHDELNSSAPAKKVQIHWHYDKLKLCKHTHIHLSFSVAWQWWQPMVLSTLFLFFGSEFCGVYLVLHEKLYVVRTCSRWCRVPRLFLTHTHISRAGSRHFTVQQMARENVQKQVCNAAITISERTSLFPAATADNGVRAAAFFSSLLLLRFGFSYVSCHNAQRFLQTAFAFNLWEGVRTLTCRGSVHIFTTIQCHGRQRAKFVMTLFDEAISFSDKYVICRMRPSLNISYNCRDIGPSNRWILSKLNCRWNFSQENCNGSHSIRSCNCRLIARTIRVFL